MHADAKQTDFCVYLSAILLVGLLLNSRLEFGWANPVAALAMTPTSTDEIRRLHKLALSVRLFESQ
jgi:hypothetical protein